MPCEISGRFFLRHPVYAIITLLSAALERIAFRVTQWCERINHCIQPAFDCSLTRHF